MSKPVFQTRARGKLLLTGEYAVLDGALALAVPVRFGQSLQVEALETDSTLLWRAGNPEGVWLESRFQLPDLAILQTNDAPAAERLAQILHAARRLNPAFLQQQSGLLVSTQTDFPRNWGLGTSSTLIAALARWADADPYQLLADTFGGSGYDIACAYAETPILFRLDDGRPQASAVEFRPAFTPQLYFIFLGKKQDSREGIRRYREKTGRDKGPVQRISELTQRAVEAGSLAGFEEVLSEHEHLLSQLLELPRARDLYFPDYWGEIKSLGAWGGDFVLATSARSEAETRAFFNEKGFGVFMRWNEMIK